MKKTNISIYKTHTASVLKIKDKIKLKLWIKREEERESQRGVFQSSTVNDEMPFFLKTIQFGKSRYFSFDSI